MAAMVGLGLPWGVAMAPGGQLDTGVGPENCNFSNTALQHCSIVQCSAVQYNDSSELYYSYCMDFCTLLEGGGPLKVYKSKGTKVRVRAPPYSGLSYNA